MMLVRRDREQDQQPEERVAHELADARASGCRLCWSRSISDRAEQRPDDRADPAEDVDAADDDGGDDLELEALAGGRP